MRSLALLVLSLLLLPACWKPGTGEDVRDGSTVQNDYPERAVTQSPVARSEPNEKPLSTREVASLASASVVTLEMELTRDEVSQGSAFYVTPGIIATNYHVIEGSSTGVARHQESNQVVRIEDVLAYDEEWDVALLAVSSSSRMAQALTLGHLVDAAVGDPVYVMGSPQGLEATFSQGVISSLRGEQPYQLIQLTAPISPGSSGGPVLNEYGQVIGVATGSMVEGQNLNFAVPVAVLHDLLANIE